MRLRGRAGVGAGVHLAAGLGIVGVAGYVYVAVVGRVFDGVEGASQVSALISVYLLINIIGPGIFTALEQETSRAVSTARARGHLIRPNARRAAWLAAAACAALTASILVAWPLLLGQVFDGQVGLLAALLVATVGSAAVYWARGVLGGQQRFRAYAVTFYVEGSVRLFPLLVLLLVAVANPTWYGLVFALGSVVGAIAVLPALRSQEAVTTDAPRPDAMGRSFALLVGATALSQLIANLAPVVVTYRLSDDAVGASVFASTFVLARVPLFLFAPVLAVLLPRFSRDVVRARFDLVAHDLRRTVLLLLLVGGAGVVVGSTVGPWAVQVLFNTVERPGAGVMALLGAATVLVMFALVLQAVLVALGRQTAVTTGWVLGAVVFVVLLVSPLPPLVGALVAQLAGPLVVAGYLVIDVLRTMADRSAGRARSSVPDVPGTVAARGQLGQEAEPLRSNGVLGNGRVNDDVWVVIPVFNEAPVLESVIRQVLAVFPNVVCVDDGSGDGSAEVVLRTGAHLVRHPVNLGQGAALQTGLSYARVQADAQYFVTYDADGQHRLEDALAMLEVARSGSADVVLGTRFAEDAASVPLLKRVVLRIAVLLSPAGRKLRLTDAHNGLRVLTRPVADDLYITMNGMAHASEIVSYLGRSRWRVREIPVSIRYTEYSRSKGQSLLNGVNILFDLSVRHRGG